MTLQFLKPSRDIDLEILEFAYLEILKSYEMLMS